MGLYVMVFVRMLCVRAVYVLSMRLEHEADLKMMRFNAFAPILWRVVASECSVGLMNGRRVGVCAIGCGKV